jgi:hypothetical protein
VVSTNPESEYRTLNEAIDASTEQFEGQGVIQMLWLWHQWGPNDDGTTYNHWGIGFWWWTEKTPTREVMVYASARGHYEDGLFSYHEASKKWMITFETEFIFEYEEWEMQPKGKGGKGKLDWCFIERGVAWQGDLQFTVTVEPAVLPLP